MGFIYLRGEYRYLLEIMERAVADAYDRGFLGKKHLRLRCRIPDRPRKPARGAYEVGEESALMESLEGKARRAAHQAAIPCRCRPLWRTYGYQ